MVVGEPFRFGVDLYIRQGIPVSRAEILRPATYEGFTREDLLEGNNRNKRRTVRIGRTRYDVYPQERSLLIPLGPGTRILGDMEYRLTITRGFRGTQKRIPSVPLKLEVVEPPRAGRPAGYVPGAVGSFELQGGPDTQEVRVGERVLVEMRVRGTGNLDAVPRPTLPSAKGLSIDPVPGHDCPTREIGDSGLRGVCVFHVSVVADRPGSYTLGPATLPHFNPSTMRYAVASAGPWTLHVLPSTNPGAAARAAAEDEEALRKPLAPPLLDRLPPGAGRGGSPWPKAPPPWLAYPVPLLVLLLLQAFSAWRARRHADPLRTAHRILARARKELRQATPAERADATGRALRRALVACFALDPRGRSLAALAQELRARGLSEELAQTCTGLLEEAETARFSGGGAPDLAERALACLDSLEAAL